jgi:hypothetical protein
VAARRRKPSPNAGATATRVVRRREGAAPGLRKLPPDYEDLAAGRRDTLRPRRRPRGRIGDTRVAGLIAGVANHEARRVYDARVERVRKDLESGSEGQLGRQLFEAVRLGIWRARSVVDFEAFAMHVLGIEPARATELAKSGAAEAGLELERLPDLAVAMWIRSEAALLERCPLGTIDVRVADDKILISLLLPLAPSLRVAESVAAIGRSATGLARVLLEEEAPREDRDQERGPGGRERNRWRGPR